MEEEIGINLKLPKDFSIKLDRWILDLKEKNVRTSKADLIIKLAIIGFNKEHKK